LTTTLLQKIGVPDVIASENSALLFFHGVRWQVAGQGD
jgi:hypothetical protein